MSTILNNIISSSSNSILGNFRNINSRKIDCDDINVKGLKPKDMGIPTLFRSTIVPTGNSNCPTGGFKIDIARDKNRNGIFNNSEITDTFYVCNGVNNNYIYSQNEGSLITCTNSNLGATPKIQTSTNDIKIQDSKINLNSTNLNMNSGSVSIGNNSSTTTFSGSSLTSNSNNIIMTGLNINLLGSIININNSNNNTNIGNINNNINLISTSNNLNNNSGSFNLLSQLFNLNSQNFILSSLQKTNIGNNSSDVNLCGTNVIFNSDLYLGNILGDIKLLNDYSQLNSKNISINGNTTFNDTFISVANTNIINSVNSNFKSTLFQINGTNISLGNDNNTLNIISANNLLFNINSNSNKKITIGNLNGILNFNNSLSLNQNNTTITTNQFKAQSNNLIITSNDIQLNGKTNFTANNLELNSSSGNVNIGNDINTILFDSSNSIDIKNSSSSINIGNPNFNTNPSFISLYDNSLIKINHAGNDVGKIETVQMLQPNLNNTTCVLGKILSFGSLFSNTNINLGGNSLISNIFISPLFNINNNKNSSNNINVKSSLISSFADVSITSLSNLSDVVLGDINNSIINIKGNTYFNTVTTNTITNIAGNTDINGKVATFFSKDFVIGSSSNETNINSQDTNINTTFLGDTNFISFANIKGKNLYVNNLFGDITIQDSKNIKFLGSNNFTTSGGINVGSISSNINLSGSANISGNSNFNSSSPIQFNSTNYSLNSGLEKDSGYVFGIGNDQKTANYTDLVTFSKLGNGILFGKNIVSTQVNINSQSLKLLNLPNSTSSNILNIDSNNKVTYTSTQNIPVSSSTFDNIFGNAFLQGYYISGDTVLNSNAILTSDVIYDNLTINAGATLFTRNYRVFVRGTLVLNGTISCNSTNNVPEPPGTFNGGYAPLSSSTTYGVAGFLFLAIWQSGRQYFNGGIDPNNVNNRVNQSAATPNFYRILEISLNPHVCNYFFANGFNSFHNISIRGGSAGAGPTAVNNGAGGGIIAIGANKLLGTGGLITSRGGNASNGGGGGGGLIMLKTENVLTSTAISPNLTSNGLFILTGTNTNITVDVSGGISNVPSIDNNGAPGYFYKSN